MEQGVSQRPEDHNTGTRDEPVSGRNQSRPATRADTPRITTTGVYTSVNNTEQVNNQITTTSSTAQVLDDIVKTLTDTVQDFVNHELHWAWYLLFSVIALLILALLIYLAYKFWVAVTKLCYYLHQLWRRFRILTGTGCVRCSYGCLGTLLVFAKCCFGDFGADDYELVELRQLRKRMGSLAPDFPSSRRGSQRAKKEPTTQQPTSSQTTAQSSEPVASAGPPPTTPPPQIPSGSTTPTNPTFPPDVQMGSTGLVNPLWQVLRDDGSFSSAPRGSTLRSTSSHIYDTPEMSLSGYGSIRAKSPTGQEVVQTAV